MKKFQKSKWFIAYVWAVIALISLLNANDAIGQSRRKLFDKGIVRKIDVYYIPYTARPFAGGVMTPNRIRTLYDYSFGSKDLGFCKQFEAAFADSNVVSDGESVLDSLGDCYMIVDIRFSANEVTSLYFNQRMEIFADFGLSQRVLRYKIRRIPYEFIRIQFPQFLLPIK